MAHQSSTGLRNYMLATGSMKAALDAGFIKIYSGTPPVSADDAPTGTLLSTISVNSTGTGLAMDSSASDGVLSKPSGVVWSGANAATGVAGYYRFVGASDTAASSTSEPRMQGRCGTVGAELILSSTSLTSGATQTIDQYSFVLPTF